MSQSNSRNEGENQRDNSFIKQEIIKRKVHIVVEIIEYVAHSVLSKTIMRKATGNVTISSFDAGEEMAERSSPYDSYIQIIDGSADIFIDKEKFKLKLGEGIVIPAHSTHFITSLNQFKMISTIIKSGYED